MNNVDLWNNEFKNSLNDLTMLVKETKSYINYDDCPDENYSPEEAKMINATVGSYLRGESEIIC